MSNQDQPTDTNTNSTDDIFTDGPSGDSGDVLDVATDEATDADTVSLDDATRDHATETDLFVAADPEPTDDPTSGDADTTGTADDPTSGDTDTTGTVDDPTSGDADTTDSDGERPTSSASSMSTKELVRRIEDRDDDEVVDVLDTVLEASDAGNAVSEELVRRDPDVDTEDVEAPDVDELGEEELVLWVEQQETPEPEDVRDAIIREVKEYYDSVDLDVEFAERPSDEFIETRWFDFSYLDDVVQIERHWVNRPYAYVSILFDTRAKEFRYHVNEVTLDGFESYVREDLTRILRNSLMYQDIDADAGREVVFEERSKEEIAEHAATVEDGSIYKLLYYLLRDFLAFGKIDPLMRDEALEDISCDGIDVPVFVYHRAYRDLRTNVVFPSDQLASFVVQLAQRAGKHISVSDPLVDASLPDGSRIQLTLGGEIATRGSNFTVRKFADVPYTPVDLIKWNTFDVDQMAYFWLAIENNKSLVFAGGTGSGKTTSMNAIGFFIPHNSKVVSIEDTREMTLPHDNWIQSVTRESVMEGGRGEVSMYELLQAALRQRPEYLLVGEVRTEQRVGLTFFNAIATGHTSYTTIHADSVDGALGRLANPPLSIPAQLVQDLDVIAIQKQIFQDDERVRRNQEIAEILPTEDFSDVSYQTVFDWDPREDVYVQVNDSHLLAEIAEERGWSTDGVQAELAARRDVLAALVDADITDYDDVTTVIHDFAKDRDAVLDAVDTDGLDAYLGNDPNVEDLFDDATETATESDDDATESGDDATETATESDDDATETATESDDDAVETADATESTDAEAR
ncbi:ATPase, T2SS/T4P/T4SS family [Halorubellus litoreus]|uniref:ATPase, T2SS/T4P/T4SS family n=1 Tax=Halorubellus litoreus TaxID=755308 RepID=A0ABD5VPH3_9EURY